MEQTSAAKHQNGFRKRDMNGNLSIIIPCYNEGALLEKALRSVVAQIDSERTASKIEILVVDDRSSDPRTLSALNETSRLSPIIHVLRNTGPKGSAAARNFGIAQARHSWIAFLDADDLWTKDSLQLRLKAISSHPKAEWIASDFLILDEHGHLHDISAHAGRAAVQQVLRAGIALEDGWFLARPVREFIHISPAWTGGVMCKKSTILRAGGFNEGLLNAQDVHLWIRLAAVTDLYYLNHPLAIYRIRPGSQTNSGKPPGQWGIRAYQQLLSDPDMAVWAPDIRRRIAEMARSDAHFFRHRGRFLKSASSASLAIRSDPKVLANWRELAKTPLALLKRHTAHRPG